MGITMEAKQVDILVWATPKLWLEDWGGGSNLWISWVKSVDIGWKYYKRTSLQISNLQSFQLPSIGNDILSCKIKSKGSGWIKGLYSKQGAIIVQLYTWKQMLTSGNAWGAVYYDRLIQFISKTQSTCTFNILPFTEPSQVISSSLKWLAKEVLAR